jgi:arylsulfatase A-like enzyme
MHSGQEGSVTRLIETHHHESRDIKDAWRFEGDRNVAQTVTGAMEWLQGHHKEEFFLYIDTWDPHEPWDAPSYYTEMYMPDYDGEVVQPIYGHWQDSPGYTDARVRKALASYRGEVTMVDTWMGYLLRMVENMGLMENTAIIFTSDHGFYFGEHDGLFGKLTFDKGPDGALFNHGDANARWDFSPLYEEIVLLPLLVYVPGAEPGVYGGLTSAVDVMPTVLEMMDRPVPEWVEGISMLPRVHDRSAPGRDFTVTTVPFANPGDPVRSVDNIRRQLGRAPVTTVTTDEWSLLYSVDEGASQLYHLPTDPNQTNDLISGKGHIAANVHQRLIKFMAETRVPEGLVKPRSNLLL